MNPFVRARNLLAAQLTPRRIGDQNPSESGHFLRVSDHRPSKPTVPGSSPVNSLFFMESSRDRIAPNYTLRHPVWPIVALQRRVRFSARLGRGFAGVGVTRDALEGLKRPHFRFWSLISIFECHVCAKGGERVADRAVQRWKRGRTRGPESRPGLPRRSRLARSGPGAARAWIQVSARERGIPLLDGVFPARTGNPNRRHRLRHTPDLGLATVDDDRNGPARQS